MAAKRNTIAGAAWNHLRNAGFSLLELLLAMTILAVILILVTNVFSFFLSISASGKSGISIKQGARESAGYITRRVTRATLNSYFDYVDNTGAFRSPLNAASFHPAGYKIASDLHFISGPASVVLGQPTAQYPGHAILFQAGFGSSPAGTGGLSLLLNACGIFVEFSQRTGRPSFLDGILPTEPYRYRLVEVMEPAESFSVYKSTKPLSGAAGYNTAWVSNLLNASISQKSVIADNVILLLVLPKLSPALEQALSGNVDGSYLAPTYLYDSRSWQKNSSDGSPAQLSANTLPPTLEIILVSISEAAAKRIENGSTPPLAGVFDGLFTNSAKLNPSGNDEGDLSRMETKIQQLKLDYRISKFEVPLLAARWMIP